MTTSVVHPWYFRGLPWYFRGTSVVNPCVRGASVVQPWYDNVQTVLRCPTTMHFDFDYSYSRPCCGEGEWYVGAQGIICILTAVLSTSGGRAARRSVCAPVWAGGEAPVARLSAPPRPDPTRARACACVLCPVSCVLCPVSCVLCSVSCACFLCLLCPVSCVLCPCPCLCACLYPVSSVLCPREGPL